MQFTVREELDFMDICFILNKNKKSDKLEMATDTLPEIYKVFCFFNQIFQPWSDEFQVPFFTSEMDLTFFIMP